MLVPGLRYARGVVFYMGERETPQTGRQIVRPIVIGNSKRTLEIDLQYRVLVDLRKPKYQFIVF